MKIKLPSFVQPLFKFITEVIRDNEIDYLIPLESKGALLIDLVLDNIDEFNKELIKAKVLYRDSLKYLPSHVREASVFGIFDDFVFSGRTISQTIDLMCALGIPKENIYKLAFFKFPIYEKEANKYSDVLSSTMVPSDISLYKLSRDEVLRHVQQLAIKNKIPASYDNLDWEVQIPEREYRQLMERFVTTGNYIYYGKRGGYDASALIFDKDNKSSYYSLPKIRFWYNYQESTLLITPISYPNPNHYSVSNKSKRLKNILTPNNPTDRENNIANLQAIAFTDQVSLLAFVKPYLTERNLTVNLNKTHLHRYFGPKSKELIEELQNQYDSIQGRFFERAKNTIPQAIDFYWVALEIMRLLAKVYWTQERPIETSKGFSVSQLIEKFIDDSSEDSIHAAIDFCADMNLIATFWGWENDMPFRAFRLTENGEAEVGRNDGVSEYKLSIIEKFGAVILSKFENHEAPWWVLEKIPSILVRRYSQFEIPQFKVVKNHFGDTISLDPQETNRYKLTWPNLKTEIWNTYQKKDKYTNKETTIFKLNDKLYDKLRNEVYGDDKIVATLAAIETIYELTKSKTMGHHVAILLDILSDEAGGTSYLSYSIKQILALHLDQNKSYDKNYSKQISDWQIGLNEKLEILATKREKLSKHISSSVQRLEKQGRGDLARQLTASKPFPPNNKIIPAFRSLSNIVSKMVNVSTKEILKDIQRELKVHKVIPGVTDGMSDIKISSLLISRWAYALSGHIQFDDFYSDSCFHIPEGTTNQMFIVAYDLIGSGDEKYIKRRGADRDRYIQSIITNWFIAFGGYISTPAERGGDSGFGFFPSAKIAILASSWASYHLELLKYTSPNLYQETPHAGFGIVQDEMYSGFLNQPKSEILYKISKESKKEAQKMADEAGRNNFPTVAIHSSLFFEMDEVPNQWIESEGAFGSINVKFIKTGNLTDLPWKLY